MELGGGNPKIIMLNALSFLNKGLIKERQVNIWFTLWNSNWGYFLSYFDVTKS